MITCLAKDIVSENENSDCYNSQQQQANTIRQDPGQKDRAVGLDQMNHGIQMVQGLVLRRQIANFIEDRGKKKKKVQQYTEEMLGVAESDVKSGSKIGQAQSQDELNRDHKWQGQNGARQPSATQQEKNEQNGQRQ